MLQAVAILLLIQIGLAIGFYVFTGDIPWWVALGPLTILGVALMLGMIAFLVFMAFGGLNG